MTTTDHEGVDVVPAVGVNGGATAYCLVCKAPMPAERSRRTTRFCSRDRTLASVGLPADFDPGSLEIGRQQCLAGHGGWLTYCREVQPDTPEIEAALRAVLDAVVPR